MTIIRTINTSEEKIIPKIYYKKIKKYSLKPQGLWYSLNNEWLEWVRENMPEWERKNNITIDINLKNIIILKTIEDLRAFNKAFRNKDDYTLNWDKVYSLKHGIEIQNFWEIKEQSYNPYDTHMLWFWGLDCSSGCLWNMESFNF